MLATAMRRSSPLLAGAASFRDVHEQVREMPRDLGTMLEIGTRHQVEFALP